MWPWRADVLYAYGGSHLKRKLRFDALGRPYVRLCFGQITLLRPNGKSQYGNEWLPLTERAKQVYTNFEKPTLRAVA